MVYLFAADLTETSLDTLISCCYEQMPVWRQKKLERIKSEKGKLESTGVWALLMQAVDNLKGKTSDCGYNRDEFLRIAESVKNADSEEKLLEISGINLSHSDRYVICAISTRRDVKVGCDVQKMQPLKIPQMKVARRFFCQAEYEYILAGETDEEQMERFFRYWVLKESMIKATREGMKRPLDSFFIDLKAVDDEHREPESEEYRYREFQFGTEFRAAVCVEGDEISPEVQMIKLQ